MMMLNAPTRLTKRAKAQFEQEVRDAVEPLMDKHGLHPEQLYVNATKGSRGVYPSVQLINSDGTVAQHFAFAQDIEALGISSNMLFAWKLEEGITTSILCYPLSPDDDHPMPEWAEAKGISGGCSCGPLFDVSAPFDGVDPPEDWDPYCAVHGDPSQRED